MGSISSLVAVALIAAFQSWNPMVNSVVGSVDFTVNGTKASNDRDCPGKKENKVDMGCQSGWCGSRTTCVTNPNVMLAGEKRNCPKQCGSCKLLVAGYNGKY